MKKSPFFDFAVWIQTSFLGDIVLSTAAFQLFKEKFPHRKQLLITTKVGAKALKDHADLDAVFVFEKQGLAFGAMQKVKRELIEYTAGWGQGITLQAHKSLRSSLLSKYLAYPVVTYRQSSGACLAEMKVERVAVLHEAVRISLLLEPLGISRADISNVKPTLTHENTGAQKIADFLSKSEDRVVALVPGSVWFTKKWPAKGYAVLARWLLQNDWRVLVLGSKDEIADAQIIDTSVADLIHSGRYLNLVGKTDLDALRFLFPRVDLVISNDSSSLHYASAFQCPSISIFGATVPAMGFGPMGTNSIVIENTSLACRPCSDHGPQRCPLGHFRCMLEIEPERVIQAIATGFQRSDR